MYFAKHFCSLAEAEIKGNVIFVTTSDFHIVLNHLFKLYDQFNHTGVSADFSATLVKAAENSLSNIKVFEVQSVFNYRLTF